MLLVTRSQDFFQVRVSKCLTLLCYSLSTSIFLCSAVVEVAGNKLEATEITLNAVVAIQVAMYELGIQHVPNGHNGCMYVAPMLVEKCEQHDQQDLGRQRTHASAS